MSPDLHKPFDRGLRDGWRRWPQDVVRGLLAREVTAGVAARDPNLETGALEADALFIDSDGTPIHIEFQAQRDNDFGLRMARYFTAIAGELKIAPEQHVVLLHPAADFAEIGTFRYGRLDALTYEVHRLWEIDPETLFGYDGLLRLVPLTHARDEAHRLELLVRATRAIDERFGSDDPTGSRYWTAQLATLYLDRDLVSDTLEDFHMPVDFSDTDFARQFRAEGQTVGRREDIRLVVRGRFGDDALADRAASVSEHLLGDVIRHAATAGTATELADWLQANAG